MQDVFGLMGTTLGQQYRVEGIIGEGGFGLVYRATHLAFERMVAVKLLKVPHYFTAEARQSLEERFRDEARLLARLGQHPSIVQVLDVGTASTRVGPAPYLVMEWLAGEDLEHELAAHRQAGTPPLSPREAAKLLEPAIDGLALAHRLSIAHRDIKPANLFLCTTVLGPTTKLLDFGIAKVMQAGDTASRAYTNVQSAFRAFTPAYGAPEQYLPKRYGGSGPWTDVHALGLILVELMIGRPAVPDHDLSATLHAIIHPTRPTPRTHGVDLGEEVERITARALALEPRDRFRDAGELHHALLPLLAHRPMPEVIPSIPPTVPLQVPPEIRASAAPLPATVLLPDGGPPTLLSEPPRFGTTALDSAYLEELEAPVAADDAPDPPKVQQERLDDALRRLADRGYRLERVRDDRWTVRVANQPAHEVTLTDGIVTVRQRAAAADDFSVQQLFTHITAFELREVTLFGFSLDDVLAAALQRPPR